MSSQFQEALRNVNPSIRISERVDDAATDKGSEMSWFGFKGYALDGQIYNRMYIIIRLAKTALHGIFNCPPRVRDQWEDIADQCFGRWRNHGAVIRSKEMSYAYYIDDFSAARKKHIRRGWMG